MAGLTDSGLDILRLPEILAVLRQRGVDSFQDFPRLSEYYKESKYADNGKNYLVLKAGKNQRSLFTLYCTVCEKDFEIKPASVLSGGHVSCFCSAIKRSTPENKLKNVVESAKRNFVRVYSDKVEKAKTPLACECLKCGYFWNSSYNSLYYKDSGCPKCNGSIRKDKKELSLKLEEKAKLNNNKIEKFHWKDSGFTSDYRVDLSCNDCNLRWQTSVLSVLQGRSCPACAKFGYQKNKPSSLYLARIISDNLIIGYKYGISCDVPRRITQHNKDSKKLGIRFELYSLWDYTDGAVAFNHEKNLKSLFKSPFSNFQLPSGSTESVLPHLLGEVLDNQNSQYKEYLNGRID